MATPDFFGASTTDIAGSSITNPNKLNNIMMSRSTTNQPKIYPNSNHSINANNNTHHVNHQGRDTEPREIPNNLLSPTTKNNNNNKQPTTNNFVVPASLMMSTSNNNNRNLSVSPAPVIARQNLINNLRTNTEPPTPEEEINANNHNNATKNTALSLLSRKKSTTSTKLSPRSNNKKDVNNTSNDNGYEDDFEGDIDDYDENINIGDGELKLSQTELDGGQEGEMQNVMDYEEEDDDQDDAQDRSWQNNNNKDNKHNTLQKSGINNVKSNNNKPHFSPSNNNNNNHVNGSKTAVVSQEQSKGRSRSNNNNGTSATTATTSKATTRTISPQSTTMPPQATSKTTTPADGVNGEGNPNNNVSRSASKTPSTLNKKRGGRIIVCVRKRPNDVEGEECVQIEDPQVIVEATKLRVDLTEYTEQHTYAFDHAFDDRATNTKVYEDAAKPLIDVVFKGGSASCFAFGQTGSGKSYTMIGTDKEPGIYLHAARDVFSRISSTQRVYVSFFEIYLNSLFDLLNSRSIVIAREDGNKRVNVCGLTWHEVSAVKELLETIDKALEQRRTGSTSANEFSSRSHAIMALTVRDDQNPKHVGILNIVDLAGSERAADTTNMDRQTRLEGAEINKSLLALKECIRGLDEKKKHIPFRGSKLTEVLRDSFTGNSRTVMIATVSPNPVNSEHTLNTIRYAFRVKGLTVETIGPSNNRKMENRAVAPIGLPAFPGILPAQQQQQQQQQQKGNNNLQQQQQQGNVSFDQSNINDQNDGDVSAGEQDGYIRHGNVRRRPHRNDIIIKRTNSQHQPSYSNGNNNNLNVNGQQQPQQQQLLPTAYGKGESPTNNYNTNSSFMMMTSQQQQQLQQQQQPPLDLRMGPIGGVGAASLAGLETRMNLQIRELRDELKNLREVKTKDEAKIQELSSMNRELLTRMDELVKLASNNITSSSNHNNNGHQNPKAAPVQLPPM